LELARRMKTAFAQNRMPNYLRMLTMPKMLIVDEVGYLGLDHEQASLLLQVICSRYEKQAATIITSNKALSDWGHVFAGDAVMASAALDRLLHRATVINIRGDFYRMKEERITGLVPGSVALSDTPKGGLRTGPGRRAAHQQRNRRRTKGAPAKGPVSIAHQLRGGRSRVVVEMVCPAHARGEGVSRPQERPGDAAGVLPQGGTGCRPTSSCAFSPWRCGARSNSGCMDEAMRPVPYQTMDRIEPTAFGTIRNWGGPEHNWFE